MLTFADLTNNKKVSIQEFRQIETSLQKDFLNRLNITGINIECYKIDIQLSRENSKFYTEFVTLPILEKLKTLNFPIKNISKFNGRTVESIEEIKHKETISNDLKTFSKKIQYIPFLFVSKLFILENNSLKQAILIK